MKRIGILLIATIGIMSCMSYGSRDPNATTAEEIEPYESWTKVNAETITGDEFGVLGRAHQGADGFREVYINSPGVAVSSGDASLPYPRGTIIVKESFSNSGGEKGRLASLTVMVKREDGYDAANGNWEYLNMSPSFRIRAGGRLNGCIQCHYSAPNDFVFTDNR